MAIDPVNIGSAPDAGDGDPARVAFSKLNTSIADLDGRATALDGTLTSLDGRVASLETGSSALKFLKVRRSTGQAIAAGVTADIAFDTLLFDTTGGVLSWSAADPEHVLVNQDCLVRCTLYSGFSAGGAGGIFSIDTDIYATDVRGGADLGYMVFDRSSSGDPWPRVTVTGHITPVLAGSKLRALSKNISTASQTADTPILTIQVVG